MAPAVMGRKAKDHQEPLVPAQDKRICGGICLCQLTFVLSSVALVYLSVAVYAPSHKSFTYGLEPDPVMCQTVNTSTINNCEWTSCSEWCLTKSSGFCPQIHVTTRRNGTHLTLHQCYRLTYTSCPMVSAEKLKRYNCNNDTAHECTSLTGVFNCSLGHCANYSELFLCHNHADGIIVDSDRDNLKLNGFFECHNSRCVKYRVPVECDRYCPYINTTSMNLYMRQGDTVITAECGSAAAHTATDGNSPGWSLQEPKIIWSQSSDQILMTSCYTITTLDNTTIEATDCINGTLVEKSKFKVPSINFTQFWSIYNSSDTPVDPEQVFLPNQKVLTIYNYSRLYINLDGCVNTLKGECNQFFNTHGNDGDNMTAQSRYTCYYHQNNSALVVTRFDLDKTWKELLVAVLVPSTLFVISFISLLVIGHTVRVGDDTKMRCQMCPANHPHPPSPAGDNLPMDGVVTAHNANNLPAELDPDNGPPSTVT